MSARRLKPAAGPQLAAGLVVGVVPCRQHGWSRRGAGYEQARIRRRETTPRRPLKYRVQQIMERRCLGFEEARDYVVKTDAGRQDCARQYYHHNIADPHLFDLVVNVEKIGPQRAAT